MSRLENLRAVVSRPQLANLLGIRPSFLTYTLYVRGVSSQYCKFSIPKKAGGKRYIKAPQKELKYIQSALSTLLLDCLDEINKEKFPKSELVSPKAEHSKTLKVKCNSARVKQPSLSHGFERQRSIITNSMMHLGKKNVLNIDLKDFFQSFNFGRVRGFFIKNEYFKLDPTIATTIAQIACYDNQLPQGSPCSPVITNLIAHSLDIRLARLAKKYSCTYSRYADDITFSTRERIFPPQLMREDDGIYTPGKRLKSEIQRSGFSLNDRKTRILYRDSRQDVTGLVVNQKPNVKKEYWRTVRAQCHWLFNIGAFTMVVDGKDIEGNINALEGKLNFIDQLDHYNRLRQKPALNPKYQLKREVKGRDSLKARRYLFSAREKTFSQFLFYRLFYANDKPTILTEGKTDNIYLKSAIQSLAASYPKLAIENPYQLLCHFVSYTERTRFLLELYGGADYLKGFIDSYKDNFEMYKAPKPRHPVIVFVDNDSGPKDIISRVNGLGEASVFPPKIEKVKDVRKADFTHLMKNLYLVLTPRSEADKDTDIEFFFKDEDRLRKFNGKYFNTVDNRDETKDLSKEAFARNIVKFQRKSIDFSKFTSLLDRVVAVIDHYETIK
ncbi:retron Ec67 family RNA-directed DNA polymerase/endonuclease [Hahella sp. HN01]|uniref:retron Ec67 family RNA-directed DNA polymerase/endonuclease n=1 Tax=Hahella sp. HN01 TaxID=2847262 RepID=UPI001C1EC18E|nr:retron Ec67 family RNA-directed DNA polymerase/endonuclease [Hahella sp. HN01]MBU6954615.1 retron Ec67 family RNA-directed DNA polymerase/endonuclease [Hahella sp. HN01]